MHARAKAAVAAIAVLAAGACAGSAGAWSAPLTVKDQTTVGHVLVLSVDGMHESDLQWYADNYPTSALAQIADGGADFTGAQTPFPSDSFPGTVGMFTGGDPGTTGVYYDDTYNYDLDPPGTTDCKDTTPGTPVNLDESIDDNSGALDAGEGLSGLPDSILQMTGKPQTVINTAQLPVNPITCKPVEPWQYLKVNTVFDVAHNAGLLTAYSDKHAAYSILDGPSGTGIDDLFTPEINSNALEPGGTPWPGGIDYTGNNVATQQYDSYKVQAVENEIAGLDHSGTEFVGVPAIFGMNFQTVSTAEKLPQSQSVLDGPLVPGGYVDGGNTPGPLVIGALNYVNAQVAAMLAEIKTVGLSNSIAIILTAKHGQSPIDPAQVVRVPDGPIITAIDSAWAQTHPYAPALIAAATDDDGMLLWTQPRTQAAANFVADYLTTHSAAGNQLVCSSPTVCDPTQYQSTTVQQSGLTKVYAGIDAAKLFHVGSFEPRHPDVVGISQVGIVYTGGHGKIAEHGGDNPDDRDVPLVVYAPGVVHSAQVAGSVEITQIAPTILQLLGLNPAALAAVRREGTQPLPGVN